MSYDGHINFGMVGDYDLLWDIDELADDVRESLAELADAAGVTLTEAPLSRLTVGGVRDRLADRARALGLGVRLQPLGLHTDGRRRRSRGRLPGGRDRQVDRVRGRRRAGSLRRLRPPPDRYREAGRGARPARRGPPGSARTRCAPPPASDRRRAAAGTTCRWSSTRTSSPQRVWAAAGDPEQPVRSDRRARAVHPRCVAP